MSAVATLRGNATWLRLARRVVVYHHLRRVALRQVGVAGTRLGVDQRQQVAVFIVDLRSRHQLDAEQAQHGAVLGAADDAAEDDPRLDVQVPLVQKAHTDGGADRIRVRVVVDLDVAGAAAPDRVQEREQRAGRARALDPGVQRPFRNSHSSRTPYPVAPFDR
jgi:hypothetical protein